MATYKISAPDGKTYKINGPDGATDDQIRAEVIRQNPHLSAPSAPAAQPAAQDATPDWAGRNPTLYGIAGATKETLAPVLQAMGAAAGGIAGTPAGPLGQVGGAALGYAIPKTLTDMADVALGNRPAPSMLESTLNGVGNLQEGAAYEVGGQAAGKAIGAAASGIGKGYNLLRNAFAGKEGQVSNMLARLFGNQYERATVAGELDQMRTGVPNEQLNVGDLVNSSKSPEMIALANRAAAAEGTSGKYKLQA